MSKKKKGPEKKKEVRKFASREEAKKIIQSENKKNAESKLLKKPSISPRLPRGSGNTKKSAPEKQKAPAKKQKQRSTAKPEAVHKAIRSGKNSQSKQAAPLKHSKSIQPTQATKDRPKPKEQDTIFALNHDILSRFSEKKKYKGTKSQIDSAKAYIAVIEERNAAAKYQILKLKKEQIRRGTKAERIRQIDEKLKADELKIIPIFQEKNHLNMLKGKDFWHIIDNGFKVRKTKNSTFLKSKNPSLLIARKLKRDIKEAIEQTEEKIGSKNITRAEKRRLTKIRDVLKGKLTDKININIKALKAGNMNILDEGADLGYDSFSPILVDTASESIRFNI